MRHASIYFPQKKHIGKLYKVIALGRPQGISFFLTNTPPIRSFHHYIKPKQNNKKNKT